MMQGDLSKDLSSRWSSTITNEIQDSHRVNGNGWGVITKLFFFLFLVLC
jgi:hypothetical protein